MTKRMLIDTTHAEETRVVVLDGNRLDDYDVETSSKKQLKGNIYLAKIVRIEPSLQAAFVEYGGNRHGFLAFSEIHPDYYQIPVADRERLIALQEEEARAEEARADRDEADAEDAPETPSDDLHGDDEPHDDQPVREMPLEIDADTVEASAETPDAAPDDAPEGEREGEPDDDTDAPSEPAPEIVGGESPDDGQAQRRTARFLRQYKIQEVMRRRQILLVQVVKEERGNKGAALTTYISLAGRFCVLMPNSLRGGGVSRKITSAADRKRLKEITSELEIPRGMGMIVRTAGAQRPRPEIRRDCEYLLRTWDEIRETTLASTAPCLVYEEASLIKRAIRDVYTRDVEEIVVDGQAGWKAAREFMRTLMPANAGKVNLWRDQQQSLFSANQVEHHLDAMLQPTVQLKSGGYLVINQTEALVAIDVNSGRSTRERSVEETAFRTNIEAADEVARQLRLRDLAGLIVIDFIDMDVRRNNATVERRLKDALRHDRARIQVGSISHFGLMEMSRQRLRPSISESSFVPCGHCGGSGMVRGTESSALHVLRAIEEEAGRRKAAEILVHVAGSVALYVLNHKRVWLHEIETRHQVVVHLTADDTLLPPNLRIDRVRPYVAPASVAAAPEPIDADERDPATDANFVDVGSDAADTGRAETSPSTAGAATDADGNRRRKRRRRGRGSRREDGTQSDGADTDAPGTDATEATDAAEATAETHAVDGPTDVADNATGEIDGEAAPVGSGRGRRRRGGRNRHRSDGATASGPVSDQDDTAETASSAAPSEPLRTPAYNGPTPADPFAGSFDIFEMLERDAEPETRLIEPASSAAALPTLETEPEPAPAPEPTPVEAVVPEPEALVAEVKPRKPRARRPKAASPEAEPVVEAPVEVAPVIEVTEPADAAAAPKRVRKQPAKPRRAKAEAVAAEPEQVSEPVPDMVAEPATAPPVATPGVDPSIVQPKVIDDDAAPVAPKKGWWRR